MTGTVTSGSAARPKLSPGSQPEAARVREWRAPFLVDVRVTLSVHGRGRSDPTFRIDEAGAVWRTSLTPDGPATIRVTGPSPAAIAAAAAAAGPAAAAAGPAATAVLAKAWGPGADWLLDALPAALGLYDDDTGFDPSGHPVLHRAARRHPGLRLSRSGRLMEALVPAVLEQKVLTLEAHRAWRILLAKFGGQPPGPAPRGMRVFPDPRTWRRIPSWDWHRAGVEGVRSQTIIRACTVADSLERLLTKTHDEADRRGDARAARPVRGPPAPGDQAGDAERPGRSAAPRPEAAGPRLPPVLEV